MRRLSQSAGQDRTELPEAHEAGHAVGELRPDAQLTPERIAAFTAVMQENIRHGELAFRRAYIRAVADQIEIDDVETRIHGRAAACSASWWTVRLLRPE